MRCDNISGYNMEMLHLSLLTMLCVGLQGSSSSDILQRQKRNWIIDSFSIEEENKGPFPYKLGKIQVEKTFTYFGLHGQGVEKDPKNILSIDKDTGEISVHGSVDRETYALLKLTFEALDKDKHIVDTRLGVEVSILDINDNAPLFSRKVYEINVKEGTSQGTNLVIVHAHDDDFLKVNNEFYLRMLSVSPEPSDLEFKLVAREDTGTISFNGCLDHEKAEKYTITLEAKDHGDAIQLSSTCQVIVTIEDGNNHLPLFTSQSGPGRVTEGEENVLALRLHVTDQDSEGTEAWRAVYKIHGDTNSNFNITTDPATNDGLLMVVKELDYELQTMRNLTISVENEVPYQSCEVQKRNTNGAWDVLRIEGEPGTGRVPPLSVRHVTLMVDNINEPPFFTPSVKHVWVMENVPAGLYLETFTAKDVDFGSHFTFRKGEDTADWVTVDPKTGKVTTSKVLDRESSFVKNNVYRATVYAVDNGSPPLTGTATLNIHIKDENDNVPSLMGNFVEICHDGPAPVNITAFDLDEEPYSGPFRFKLHGDVKGKWRVEPTYGYSVSLIKEKKVHSGHYELLLEICDLQDNSAKHNLSIAVCECLDVKKPNCRVRKAVSSSAGGAVFGLIFVAALLIVGVLLLALLLSCKKKATDIPDEDSGEHLMISNTEKMGVDCEVVFHPSPQGNGRQSENIATATDVLTVGARPQGTTTLDSAPHLRRSASVRVSKLYRGNKDLHQGAAWYQQRSSKYRSWAPPSKYSMSQEEQHYYKFALILLEKRMLALQTPGEELGDYAPRLYTDEGHTRSNTELDSISIPEIPFDPELDLDLDYKFTTLASMCKPDLSTA